MESEEIKEKMLSYENALKKEKDAALTKWTESDADSPHELADTFKAAKENAHKVAMEVLNEILTPELKVFVKNLCLDRLQYPDDPIFYKAFGEYPQVGDKISEDELKTRGIDITSFEVARDIWDFEDSCFVIEEEIDGKKYWVIEVLYETDVEETKKRREWLEKAARFKRLIAKKYSIDSASKHEIFESLNELSPLAGRLQL